MNKREIKKLAWFHAALVVIAHMFTKGRKTTMEKVRLQTKSGELIITGLMPAFIEYPEMVVWGNRTFQLQTVGKTGDPTIYNEVSCFVITETV